jgi:hypothetical protein
MTTTMTTTIRKTRRPIGMRTDIPAHDPRQDRHPDGGTMDRCAFFEHREDALEAAREWVEPQGWIVHAQYVGRYDLWVLEAKRKSWGYRFAPIMVEACRSPEAVVVRHACVPMAHSYASLLPRLTAENDSPREGR